MLLGRSAYLGSGPRDLAVSPPCEQGCWHLYFLCDMVHSKPKPPNPGPLPLLKAPSPACSPGLWLPSRKSSLCVPLPVLGEAARHSFPHSGRFPTGSQGPGTGAVCGPRPPVLTPSLARERTVAPSSLDIQATSQVGVAAARSRRSRSAGPRLAGLVKPGLQYRVRLWAPH